MPTAVSVRFFASLREAVGEDRMDLDIEAPRVSGVRSKLESLLGAEAFEALSANGVRVCVNQMIVRDDVGLCTGDEVAFLPPVTGG
ncbi:MAG: MoaD/ThiS family protein [Gammaproteobacteria bacterium]|nr:MoaD/ThiS family protein [Gammaproteobacteria bacterium]